MVVTCGFYNGSACNKSGVGCGTLAEMNAITPTAPGLGFWATNQSCSNLTGMTGRNPTTPISGTLYRAEDDGKGGFEWVVYYTPFQYPHPFRLLGTACIHKSEIPPCDGCVAEPELMTFLNRWYISNVDVTMGELMEAIGWWKKGC